MLRKFDLSMKLYMTNEMHFNGEICTTDWKNLTLSVKFTRTIDV